MSEYGTGNSRVVVPVGTCFYPKDIEDEQSPLCDRAGLHPGRHATWDKNNRRIYWKE